jgi:hypothetical protein
MAARSAQFLAGFVFAIVVLHSPATAAEEESPAKQAIKEALTILEARMAKATEKADQQLLGEAIAQLQRLAGSKADPAPSEGSSDITPALLKKKFAGKAAYNAKTGELTLIYDFSNKDQLRDFEKGEAAVTLKNGVLRVGPGESLKHLANFRTARVTGVFTLEHVKESPFILSANGVLVVGYDFGGTGYQLSIKGRAVGERRVGGGIEGKPVPLTIEFGEKRAVVRGQGWELGEKVEGGNAGRIAFLGGKGGTQVRSLVISGPVDEAWAAEFFAK